MLALGSVESVIKTIHDIFWESPAPDNPWAWAPMVYLLAGLFVVIALYLRLYSFKTLRHALDIVRGKYDHPNDPGEVTHRQALFTALSGTVGLGNIAGVAIAVSVGGPGIIPWMILFGFLGMSVKFCECSLATKYRVVNPDGSISGGPMYYIQRLAKIGAPLVLLYAAAMVFSSMVGSNLFQVHEAAASLEEGMSIPPVWTGIAFATLTAIVVFGGIKWIGWVAERVVPFMGISYLVMAIAVIAINWQHIPDAAVQIVQGAFYGSSALGAFKGAALGTTIAWALNRALFSSEAGLGSAATAHAAAKTKEPIREGVVAMLEPFVDTVIICTLTGLVIAISGVWTEGATGVVLTQQAFSSVHPWLGQVGVPLIVVLLSFTTVIGWSYYGMQATRRLFGAKAGPYAVFVFNVAYVACAFFGAIWSLDAIVNLGNVIMAGMLLINGTALVLYLREVKRDFVEYRKKYIDK